MSKSEFANLNNGQGDIEASAGIQEFDEVNDVPLEEKFSWNPYDWYVGIKRELSEFSFEMTERKRVVSSSIFDCIGFIKYILFFF